MRGEVRRGHEVLEYGKGSGLGEIGYVWQIRLGMTNRTEGR